MIGLDTNVVVRYFTQDDKLQSALAARVFATLNKSSQGFISLIVLCETVWVLQDCYAVKKPALLDILRTLLESDELLIESKQLVWQGLQSFTANSLDFSDAIISVVNEHAGCEATLTFDKAAAKSLGFKLLTNESVNK